MNEKPQDLYTLLAASSYLMTRYSLRCSGDTAQGVVHHLKMLLAHPEIQSSASARAAYHGLLHDWQQILIRHTRPHPLEVAKKISLAH